MIAIHTTTDTVAMWVILTFVMAFVGFCFWQNRHRVVDPEKPNEYDLRKISDLLRVPKDRRVECLAELYNMLAIMEVVIEAQKAKLPKWLHWILPFLIRIRKVVWKDDGEDEGTISVNGKEIWSTKEGVKL
jgi:hypothetical protein